MDSLGGFVPGNQFEPENATVSAESDVPFRIYRVAVPAGATPRVSLSVKKTKPMQGNFCKGGKLNFFPVSASSPYMRDGLWMVDIRVPLYEKAGASFRLRTQYRLTVEFSVTGSGINPGKRAVSRVMNENGASHFGVSRNKYRNSLRRSASSDLSDVHFIAKFVVGDQNVAATGEDGLYALDFKTVQKALLPYYALSELNSIPVEKLRLFGASPDTMTAMVPGPDVLAPVHLFDIPFEVRDHSKNGNSMSPDGTFNEGDSIVFVGYGSSYWKLGDSAYYHTTSPYSFYQHFQLGWSDTGKGKRLKDKISFSSSGAKDVPLMRYVRAEKDAFLIDTYYGKELDWEKNSGKEWFWFWHSRIDTTVVSSSELLYGMPQMKNLPGRVDGGQSLLQVTYFPHRSVWKDRIENVAQSGGMFLSAEGMTKRMEEVRFLFDVNGKKYSRADATLGAEGNFWIKNPPLKDSDNAYVLTMLPNGRQYDRFDGFTVAYQWTPVVDTAEWYLPGRVSGKIRMPVPDGVSLMKFVNMVPVGVLENSGKYAVDSVAAGEDVRYLAYREIFRNGENRNLITVEGLPAPSPDVLSEISKINSKTEYLIITPPEFIDGAVMLGKFRSEGQAVSKYATTVVNVEDIYRLYTGGSLSPIAIRNYIAYAYSLCPDLKYVLLLGTGHYDYRGAIEKRDKNFMPPFELEDNVTEDFFAALDSGEMVRYGFYDLDLAVGRLPVRTPDELSDYIEKAKEYEMVGRFDHSEWRNTVILAADDAKNGTEIDKARHAETQEQEISQSIDKLVDELGVRWNQKKIYLLDYEADAAGQKKDATADFLNLLNQGALLAIYFGHGSKTDWASEGLLKPSYIPRLSNQGRYTILNSFSCIVGRFDQGGSRSLSEEFVVARSAGSIVSIGATRETFGQQNKTLGKNFIFGLLRNDGISVGDAFMQAKNMNTSKFQSKNYDNQRFNNEHYTLFGEPLIKMLKNGFDVTLDQKIDTLKALDKMKLSGSVKGMENGTIELSLRGGRSYKNMYLGFQVNEKDATTDSIKVSYDGSLIYSEKIPVVGGRYKTEFVTPRKISFGDTAVELNAWAYSKDDREIGRFRVGGISISGFSSYADSLHDSEPPIIKIQNCYSKGTESSFSEGETVKLQAPACLQVVVEDSTALDFREQPDEGLSIEIQGVENPYHPYPFLEQSSKKAVFRKTFTLENYPEGSYLFRVRALDVLGNMAVKSLNIEIAEDMKAGLADVFNVPNPVGKKGTTFFFKNLAVDRESTVNIFIYNQHGRLVKVIKDAVSGVTHWDGKDNHGRKLANGLYHYVVRSEVPAVGNSKAKTWTKKQKLLISR
ncbi:MAG: hypothetical protein IK012_08260 [Fibrobacter sp.]|nr:hypothetical protein [Fibrobacter sp.]